MNKTEGSKSCPYCESTNIINRFDAIVINDAERKKIGVNKNIQMDTCKDCSKTWWIPSTKNCK